VAGRKVVSDQPEFELEKIDPNEITFEITGKKKDPNDDPDTVRSRLSTAKARLFQEYYQVGNDLFQVLNKHLYTDWGYENFAAYVDNEVGLSLNYARNYIKVFDKFNRDLGLRPDQMEGVGVSKALALTSPMVNRSNAESWIEKARVVTTTRLKEELKLSRPKRHRAVKRDSEEALLSMAKVQDPESLLVDDIDEQPIIKNFCLYPRQLDFIETVLAEMPQRTKSMKDGNNLTLLVLEHQSHRADVGGKAEERPLTILGGFEATFGGNVVWLKTREQVEAITKFMKDNSSIFEGEKTNG